MSGNKTIAKNTGGYSFLMSSITSLIVGIFLIIMFTLNKQEKIFLRDKVYIKLKNTIYNGKY